MHLSFSNLVHLFFPQCLFVFFMLHDNLVTFKPLKLVFLLLLCSLVDMCIHVCCACLHMFVCVCPIILRIFDSVYLNVSYRRSWKDMEQETSQVRPIYLAKHCLSFFFYWTWTDIFLSFSADPCQQYPSASLLAWTVMWTLWWATPW